MQRPPPARFIGRAANRHAGDLDNLELALLECPNFVWLLEPLQHHIHILSHRLVGSRFAWCPASAQINSHDSFCPRSCPALCRISTDTGERYAATRGVRAKPGHQRWGESPV